MLECIFVVYMDRIEKIKGMLETQPDDCFLLHALGLEFLKLNQIEEAILQFEKVIKVNEEYVGTYYHLGRAYEKTGNREKAVNIYEKGIIIAKSQKNMHAKSELQMVLEELIDN